MAVDNRPHANELVFNIDLAGPVDAPPVVFHTIRVPCACGRSLTPDKNTFTFFPSAVFVHGECEACGPQSAIFAPHMKNVGEKMPEAIARHLQRLTRDLARTYGADVSTVLNEFLNYLADESARVDECATESPERAA